MLTSRGRAVAAFWTETMAEAQRNYHHGDLPDVLMAKALEEIDRVGVQGLSLRALARAAGVSATAPYRHFPSKRCLLAALATRGFRLLHERVELEMNLLAPPPASDDLPAMREHLRRRLLTMGLAYLAFAEENPTSYQLMFGAVVDDFSDYAALHDASKQSFAQLQSLLAAVIDSGGGRGLSLPELCGAVWSVVHGMADLTANVTPPTSDDERTMPAGSAPAQAMLAARRDRAAVLRALCYPLLDP
ncbi:MAG: TetR/AcrR family transcriptional regulator [Pseudomonadota bacterium]